MRGGKVYVQNDDILDLDTKLYSYVKTCFWGVIDV